MKKEPPGWPQMRPDNTAPIIAAARHRHELTRARAIQAIRELDHAGSLVTFAGVAGQAGISRSWLYSQPDIRILSPTSAPRSRASGTPPAGPAQRRSQPASAPPTPHCFAAWKPLTPNEPASWKNAHGSARRTPGSAGSSPSPSANSGRPGSAAPSHCPDPSPSDNDQTPHAGPPDLAADASRSPSSTRPPRSARPQTAKLKIIFFSVVQRKVLTPNDFTGLDQIRGRLAAFETRYNAIARPFDWKFTRADLSDLLRRIDAHDKTKTHALAA